jgi:hypothetical protein
MRDPHYSQTKTWDSPFLKHGKFYVLIKSYSFKPHILTAETPLVLGGGTLLAISNQQKLIKMSSSTKGDGSLSLIWTFS